MNGEDSTFTFLIFHGKMESKEGMQMLYDEIIEKRKNEIFNEVNELEHEIAKLNELKARRMEEFNMLQHIRDHGLISSEHRIQRIDYEDAIVRIFRQAGRPLAMAEIIEKLDEFGYVKSPSYQREWSRIRRSGMVEPTGKRGYYNLVGF